MYPFKFEEIYKLSNNYITSLFEINDIEYDKDDDYHYDIILLELLYGDNIPGNIYIDKYDYTNIQDDKIYKLFDKYDRYDKSFLIWFVKYLFKKEITCDFYLLRYISLTNDVTFLQEYDENEYCEKNHKTKYDLDFAIKFAIYKNNLNMLKGLNEHIIKPYNIKFNHLIEKSIAEFSYELFYKRKSIDDNIVSYIEDNILIQNDIKYLNFLNSINPNRTNLDITCSYENIGGRDYMEDRHVAIEKKPYKFFAVYDGHGGSKVSELLKNEFHEIIFDNLDEIDGLLSVNKLNENLINKIEQKIYESFSYFDTYMYNNRYNLEIENDGSTAIIVLDIADYLIFCNLGDSRAIMFSNLSKTSNILTTDLIFKTKDQKPTDSLENKRIKNSGGYVFNGRVNGVLAISRSFGDFYSKNNKNNIYDPFNAPVSAKPVINFVSKPQSINFKLLLASDGLWDVFNTYQVMYKFSKNFTDLDKQKTCKIIVNQVLNTNPHNDNITVLMYDY